MFCLKPKDDDWDHPDFPFLYSDIESDEEAFDLETLVEGTSRPIRDDVSEDALIQFASRVNDLLGSKVRVTGPSVYWVLTSVTGIR